MSSHLHGIPHSHPARPSETRFIFHFLIALHLRRHLPDEHVPPGGGRVRAGAAEGPRVLGHRRAHDGALLRPQVLPRDRDLPQRETGG